MNSYQKYKDSGIEWIGKIPEGWEVKKLKYIVNQMQTGTTPNTKNLDYYNGNIEWFNPSDLNNEILLESQKKVTQLAVEDNEIKLFPANSILVVAIGATSGKTAYLTKQASFNQQITGFHSRENSNFYLFYLFKNYSNIFLSLANYTTLPILNNDFFKSFILPLPPKHEQVKIANYLNQKTKEIDTLIEQKEQLLELYEEEKKAIINQAVTKGIDPNAKMKDSGIEWIGEIPEGWEVKKFRFTFNLTKGLNITKADLQDEGIACINYGEIHSQYGFDIIPERDALKYVSEEYLENSKQSLLKRGDFVFADTSEDIEGSGNFSHLHSDTPIFAGYHTIIARLKIDVFYRFLAYYIDSVAFRSQIQKEVKGVKVYSITNAILKNTLLLLPPKKEQIKIVDYIEEKISIIDQKVEKTKKIITLYKEYKTALISEVVTGKIKVPEEL